MHIPSKMSIYVGYSNKTKCMYFLIKDEKCYFQLSNTDWISLQKKMKTVILECFWKNIIILMKILKFILITVSVEIGFDKNIIMKNV